MPRTAEELKRYIELNRNAAEVARNDGDWDSYRWFRDEMKAAEDALREKAREAA